MNDNGSVKAPILDKNPANFGSLCLGPYLTGFCQWVHKQKLTIDPNACLLFVVRDGYLLQQVYDILYPRDTSVSHYALASRAAIHYSGIDSEAAVVQELSACRNIGTVREALLYQFHLLDLGSSGNSDSIVDSLLDDPKCELSLAESEGLCFLEESVAGLKTEIASRARRHKDLYKNYLEDIIGERYPLVVDIGYQGRTQLFFSQILGREVGGLYLVTHEGARSVTKKAGPVLGFDGDFLPPKSSDSFVNEYRYFFEAALSSPQGSFLHFDPSGEPVHEPHLKSSRSSSIRASIHKGTLQYARNYYNEKKEGDVPPANGDSLKKFLTDPSPEDACLFSGLAFNDLFMGATGLYIVMPKSERISKYALWIEGQQAADRYFQHIQKVGMAQTALMALERSVIKHCLSKAHFACFVTNRSAYLLESDDPLLKVYGWLTVKRRKKPHC